MKDVWLRIGVVKADEYPLDCALAQDEYPAHRDELTKLREANNQ